MAEQILDERPRGLEDEIEDWGVVEVGPVNTCSKGRWPVHSGEAHVLLLDKLIAQKGDSVEVQIWGDASPVRLGVVAYDVSERKPAGAIENEHVEQTVSAQKTIDVEPIKTKLEDMCEAFSKMSIDDRELAKRKQGELLETRTPSESDQQYVVEKQLASLQLETRVTEHPKEKPTITRKKRIGESTIVLVRPILLVPNNLQPTRRLLQEMIQVEVPWIPVQKLDHSINSKEPTRVLVEGDRQSRKSEILREYFAMREINAFWITPEDIWLRDEQLLPERLIVDVFLVARLVPNSCVVIDGLDELFGGADSSSGALDLMTSWPVLIQLLLELERESNALVKLFGLCKQVQGDEIAESILHHFHSESAPIEFRSPFGLSEWRAFWKQDALVSSHSIENDMELLCSVSTGLGLAEVLDSRVQASSFTDLLTRITAIRSAVKDRALFAGDVPFSFVPCPSLASINRDDSDMFLRSVAGQREAKQALTEALLWPNTKREEMLALDIQFIRGILLYGPPGTGKTLLAQSAAFESGWNFLSVSVADLVRGDVGQSEKRVRDLFGLARACAPCVLFFDEAQGLFTSRSLLGPAGRKMVSQFLVELDSLAEDDRVVLLAATNHLDVMDEALIRPGRFDRKVFVGPLESVEDVCKAIALYKERSREGMRFSDDRIDWPRIAKETLLGLTGAEIVQVLTRALMEIGCEDQDTVKMEEKHILAALKDEGLLELRV